MNDPRWAAVDEYASSLFATEDSAMRDALAASRAAGLPEHQVSACQGRLLELLARSNGARSILEIGTLAGYSTLWLARALDGVEGGRIVTLDSNPDHATLARENIARAGLAARVEVRLGDALSSLDVLARSGGAPYDFVFVDADKKSNPAYLEHAIRLARPGTLIVLDNVVRAGDVIDERTTDANVLGVRAMNALIASDPRLLATTIQTVGSKGYDGFTLVRVNRLT